MYLVLSRMRICNDVSLMEFMYLVLSRMRICDDVSLTEFMYLVLSRMRICDDVSLMEFVYLVFTRRPGESCRRRFRSVLPCSTDVFEPKLTSLSVDSL